ncbi:MAG: DUF2092 domain-containing protein, partial [Chloroflexia bacterium]|nr:DUF2092 domain-containing protein [Chloroflexia bacterium]
PERTCYWLTATMSRLPSAMRPVCGTVTCWPPGRRLPAAARQERAPDFDATPVRKGRIAAGERQVSLVLAIALPLAIVLLTFIITDGGKRVATSNDVQPVVRATAVADQFEQAIIDARAATVANPTSIQAWVDYGNQLYNSVQIVREQQPGSPLYQSRIARWQMAADAYAKALSFDPSSVVVEADMGASMAMAPAIKMKQLPGYNRYARY